MPIEIDYDFFIRFRARPFRDVDSNDAVKKNYSVRLHTTQYYSRTTLYYKVLLQYYTVLLQYYSVLQSTTPVLLCTTKC